MPPRVKVQCSRCKEYLPEKQFEKHKSSCRGNKPPPLSGEEDNEEWSDAEPIYVGDDDDEEFPSSVYGREEMRPSMSRQEYDKLFDGVNRPSMNGKREDVEDRKWKHVKRIKGRAPPEMGMEHVKMVVGSKLARDLKRRTHFMSQKSFDAWQKKYDENKRYWAEETDIDGDDIDDFVVSKARTAYDKASKKWKVVVDEEGNPIRDIVAVNGWTTVKSDYKDRKQFIDEYPTSKDRKGKSFTKFIHSKYYTEADKDKYGYPSREYMEKREKILYEDGHKHKLHIPLPTARQDFMKRLVWAAHKEAVKDYLARHPGMERKDVKMEPGFVARVGSFYWNAWIIDTLIEDARETKWYQDLFDKYVEKFNRSKFNKDKGITFDSSNDEHMDKFYKTLLKRESMCLSINRLTKELLDEKGEYFKPSLEYLVSIMTEKLNELN